MVLIGDCGNCGGDCGDFGGDCGDDFSGVF